MTSTLDYTVQNGYITLPVTTDPSQLQASAMAAIAAALPGWVPRESHIDVLLLEQFAAMCAESAQVAATVPLAIFSYFGTLVGITPEQGAPATALSTWTMTDSKGYTIPAGTIVGYQILGNQIYDFQTTESFTVPSGQTQATGVVIESTINGAACNNFAAQDLVLVFPSVSYIASIVSTSTTSGGADPETTTDYLNRLSNQLQLLTPRPILAQDYASLATAVDGVYRAAAFNLVNPYANIMLAEDVSFASGVGTWTAVSGVTSITNTTSGGIGALEITCSGSGNAVVQSGMYNLGPANNGYGVVTIVPPTTSRSTTVAVLCYDVNGTLLATDTGEAMTVASGTPYAMAISYFTTPANTWQVALQYTVTSPSSAEVHEIICPGIITNQAAVPLDNYVPDSNITNVATGLSWTDSGSGYAVAPYASQQNALAYTGTGSGTTVTESSKAFYLAAGTYTISAYVDATFVTSGNPSIYCYYGSTAVGAVTQVEGTAGIISGTFTLGSAEQVTFVFSTNGCTVETAELLQFAVPQVQSGSTYSAYTPGPEWTPAGLVNNNERMVTLVGVDDNGNALTGDINSALQAYMEAKREVNFIVNVIDPTYTSIDVTWSATALSGYDPDAVLSAGTTALQTWLSPANWAGGSATPPYWDPTQNVVRFLTVATLLGEVPGVAYLNSLTIGYHGGSMGNSDLTLLGSAPLPSAGTLTGSVSPAPVGAIA